MITVNYSYSQLVKIAYSGSRRRICKSSRRNCEAVNNQSPSEGKLSSNSIKLITGETLSRHNKHIKAVKHENL